MERDRFHTTRWTEVLSAQGNSTQAATALADLCAAYYAPVHAYISRSVRDLGDPGDLTQDFFARVLGGPWLAGADQKKGRFRAYLLGAVKHFLADRRDRLGAAKRGGGQLTVALDAGTDTSPGFDPPAPELEPADGWFDRQWGLALLGIALDRLAAEHARAGKVAQFERLKPWLTGEADQSAAAAQLGLSEGALKVAIHRLRKRFRDLVKAEIALTVESEEEIREELRYLIEVVR